MSIVHAVNCIIYKQYLWFFNNYLLAGQESSWHAIFTHQNPYCIHHIEQVKIYIYVIYCIYTHMYIDVYTVFNILTNIYLYILKVDFIFVRVCMTQAFETLKYPDRVFEEVLGEAFGIWRRDWGCAFSEYLRFLPPASPRQSFCSFSSWMSSLSSCLTPGWCGL